jgi:hypothetical protein
VASTSCNRCHSITSVQFTQANTHHYVERVFETVTTFFFVFLKGSRQALAFRRSSLPIDT